MFPNNYNFNPGMVLDPITMAPMLSNGGSITVNPLGVPTRPQQKIWQRMFIQNIPQECSNDIMIKLLKEFGAIKNYKRTSDIKGNLASFCFFQLETAEDIMRIVRIFKNIRILDKTLQIKISPQTQNFLKQWKTMQRDQWRKKLLAPSMNQAKQYDTIEHFNERDDKKYKQKIQDVLKIINTQVKKVAVERLRQQQRKQHPRQKQRQKRKKQLAQDMKRKFNQKQDYWLKRQRQKDRQYRKQKQRERDYQRTKVKRIQRQMDLDSEQQEHRLAKYRATERRKAIQRQQQQDLDRILQENPPQPEEQETHKKIRVTVTEEKKRESRHQGVMMTLPDDREQGENNDFVIPKENKPHIFQGWEMEEEIQKQQKPNVELNLPQLGQENREEYEQNRKKMLELAKIVPQNKMELWQYPIQWDLLAKSVVFQKKIRPWLQKRSIDYIGGVQQKFIALVQKKLLSRSHPDKIVKTLKQLLEEDAEEFVVKLWKTIIFESLKLKNGIN